MPRKSKDELNNVKSNIKENTVVEKVSKKADKKVPNKKSENESVSSKKADTKASKTKKVATSSSKAKSTSKSTKSISKKVTSSKSTSKKTNSTKKTTTKKSTAKKASTKKSTKRASSSKKQVLMEAEYYDLPYRYNQTVVKILAQTPNMLFIYWDISDDDRNAYIKKYGDSFFNDTKPVLIITNKTMNYTFEVEINDFANSWYLPLNDPNCDYSVELGRRPKFHISNEVVAQANQEENNYAPLDNYIYICTSNNMEMPNNHILFDKLGKSVFFKNVKNNFIEERNISSLSFITNIGKVYNIYELYKEIYKDEIDIEDLSSDNLKLNLSSSSSSTFM